MAGSSEAPRPPPAHAYWGEQATHRISVSVLGWLPLAPGVATLVLVHFICELRVTRICLSQQAAGQARVTKGAMVANNPSSALWSGNIYSGSLLTLALGFSTKPFLLITSDILLKKGPVRTMRPKSQRTPQVSSNRGGDWENSLVGSSLYRPHVPYFCFSSGMFSFFAAKSLANSSKE